MQLRIARQQSNHVLCNLLLYCCAKVEQMDENESAAAGREMENTTTENAHLLSSDSLLSVGYLHFWNSFCCKDASKVPESLQCKMTNTRLNVLKKTLKFCNKLYISYTLSLFNCSDCFDRERTIPNQCMRPSHMWSITPPWCSPTASPPQPCTLPPSQYLLLATTAWLPWGW